MAHFPLSIASNSFYKTHADGRINLFGVFELFHSRYHVPYTDIWSGMLDSLDGDYLKKVRLEMERRDLALANLCVDGAHLWEDDPEERAAHRIKALSYIAAARALGAKTIRFDMGGRKEELSEEAFDYIVKTYREFAGLAYESGMRVGPENHWGASRVPANLKLVQEAVNHPGYGHLLHIDNFAGDPALGYDVVMPYVMHVHAGIHGIPFAKTPLRKIIQSGYQGAISVENYTGEFEFERMDWQVGAVKSLLAEIEAEGPDAPESMGFFHEIYHMPRIREV